MDADRFDSLTRTLTEVRSRRGTVAALGGVFGGVLIMSSLEEAAAKKKCPPCKKRNTQGKCKKRKRDGTACANGGTCQRGRCVGPLSTQPCVPNCGDRRCGDDGCGGPCGPGALCSGKCVNTTISDDHCGGCGQACEDNEFCQQGQCAPCQAGGAACEAAPNSCCGPRTCTAGNPNANVCCSLIGEACVGDVLSNNTCCPSGSVNPNFTICAGGGPSAGRCCVGPGGVAPGGCPASEENLDCCTHRCTPRINGTPQCR